MTTKRAGNPVLERPVLATDSPMAAMRQRVREYGPGVLIKPFENRSESQQQLITERLTYFQNWRSRLGDIPARAPADDPWDTEPPDEDTLLAYMSIVHERSAHFRAEVIGALRLYLIYHERPDLCRLVQPRGRKAA